jgi:mannonate dehydratase
VIRIAVGQLRGTEERDLAYAAQLGVQGIQLFPPDPDPARHWTVDALSRAKAACEAHGLVLESVAMHIYSHAMLGLPGADDELELCGETIRNMGVVGIPILGHDFGPNAVWRTKDAMTRGGAMATAFDMAEVEAADAVTRVRQMAPMEAETEAALAALPPDRVVSEDDMWANFARFMGAVLPTAERAGVVLAVHPDDPPVPMLGGIARILRSPAGFRRAMEVAASPAWKVLLCLGTTSEMEGGALAVREMIETFGPLGRIAYVHFRDVQGTVPRFAEAFIGDGNYDPLATLRLLRDSGFDGFIMDDHVPFMVGDSEYGHTARAHAIGYMQGLLAALVA